MLIIFVGVWGLFHQGFNGTAQMAKVGMPTTCESSDDTNHMTMLVDSGASGRYFDDELQPGLRDKLLNYKELENPHKIVTAGRHVLPGKDAGTASGVIIDEKGNRHQWTFRE